MNLWHFWEFRWKYWNKRKRKCKREYLNQRTLGHVCAELINCILRVLLNNQKKKKKTKTKKKWDKTFDFVIMIHATWRALAGKNRFAREGRRKVEGSTQDRGWGERWALTFHGVKALVFSKALPPSKGFGFEVPVRPYAVCLEVGFIQTGASTWRRQFTRRDLSGGAWKESKIVWRRHCEPKLEREREPAYLSNWVSFPLKQCAVSTSQVYASTDPSCQQSELSFE